MRALRNFFRNTRGGAAAEMALLLPLAIIMMFAGFEGAHYFYTQHQVVKGVRDGARYGARQSFDLINCRGGSGSIDSGIVDEVKNLTRTGQLSGGTARVNDWIDAEITVTVSCPATAQATTGIFRAAEPAPQINVVADVNYVSLFGGLGVINDNARLKASQQATVMGI